MLLTGRITKEIELGAATAEVQQALLGDNAAGLWQELSTAWSSAHCVGVEHRAQPGEEPAEMQDTGLLANVCYCATTGGLTLTLALTLTLTLALTLTFTLALTLTLTLTLTPYPTPNQAQREERARLQERVHQVRQPTGHLG